MNSRILTIPNVLTIARLIFLGPFIFIALDSPITGAVIAAILGFTDFLDGAIARKFNQTSELGRILDPISDRALFIISFAVFTITGSIPIWFVGIIGLREVLIILGTGIVLIRQKTRLDVTQSGKISAFASMVATPSWVLATKTTGIQSVIWTIFSWVCTLIAIPTGFYSLYEYYRAFKIPSKN